jgi:hypothetical protein
MAQDEILYVDSDKLGVLLIFSVTALSSKRLRLSLQDQSPIVTLKSTIKKTCKDSINPAGLSQRGSLFSFKYSTYFFTSFPCSTPLEVVSR